MSLRDDGYLDLAYVLPEEMGQGTADALYDAVFKAAQTAKFSVLTTEASLLARPFFAKNGWRLDAEQEILRAGVALTNFRMSFQLK